MPLWVSQLRMDVAKINWSRNLLGDKPRSLSAEVRIKEEDQEDNDWTKEDEEFDGMHNMGTMRNGLDDSDEE